VRSTAAAAEYDPCPDHKAEIIPSTVVMYFIHIDVLGKKGDDEGDGCDNAMPEPLEKTGCASIIRRHVLGGIFAREAGNNYKNDEDENGKGDD
jgi:hypothetical protein